VLDFVKSDVSRLEAKLGSRDRSRLDQHLTSIREIERQLDVANQPPSASCSNPGITAPSGSPSDEVAMPLMAKLIAFAFQCDLTRYVMFCVGKEMALPGKDYDHDHGCSHQSTDPDNIYYINKKLEHLGMILGALKASPEGEHDLLYNSLIVNGVDVAQGWRHNFDNLPLILAGNGGGQVKTGRHLHYKDVTWNNLYIAMFNILGLNVATFGIDGTGPLPGLGG
jgi:hypothetical protein